MTKYRVRKIADASIASPRRIVKRAARARAYASLHCSDVLKDESMKTPRPFADPTMSIDFQSANVRGAIGGCRIGRWQHLSGLRGRSNSTDQSQAGAKAKLCVVVTLRTLVGVPILLTFHCNCLSYVCSTSTVTI